ncbi:response regulator [bacterium]|nr:response regulator [bacterium]
MANKNPKKILVVDDEADMRWILTNVLKKEGYRVITADDGKKAVQKVMENDPDIILLDIRMPEMDGIQVLEKVREINPMMPVIIITAYADIENAVQAVKLGAYDYFMKPFDTNDLLIIIKQALEKIALEKELKESKEMLSTIFNNVHDGIIFLDKTAKILKINRRVKEISGYPEEELVGRRYSAMKMFTKEDLILIVNNINKVIAGIQVSPTSHEIVTKKGKRLYVEVLAQPVRKNGRIVGSIVVIRDITERRCVEEERLKAQKLESIGIFAGGIAHNFNNRLSVILGNAQLANIVAEKGGNVTKYLQNIETSAERAKALTQQLLTFAKGGEPVKEICSTAALLNETANLSLSGSNIRSELDIQSNLWDVEIDKGQVIQVINNIILNADQAMPEGGVINISAENIPSGLKVPGYSLSSEKYIRISIRDHGIGIPPDKLDKIFDPYFTTKQNCSGLGLTTAYSVIKKHNGFIIAESVVGAGSTFIIYLPAVEREVIEEAKEKRPLKGTGRILVMDDEELVREVTGAILKTLGYEVEFAKDGAEAIELYQKNMKLEKPFDIVIMDLTVPGGMGGKEAVRKLAEIDPEVKAVVSSGYSYDPVMADFKKYGFAGVIAKPYKIEELSKTLHKVLNS